MRPRVVVTGIGLVSGLGNTTEETWEGLIQGRSGVDYITHFDASAFPVRFAAEVKNFDPLRYIEKKEVKKMDSFIHYAIAASQQAVDDSGLQITPSNAERVGVYIASASADSRSSSGSTRSISKEGRAASLPFSFPPPS